MSETTLNGKQSELVRERRRQIFDAAAKVFAGKGYHAATVSEIAREAGLGKGTLYEYVSSKKEILFLVVEEGHSMILDEIDRLISQDMTPEEKWRGAIRIQLKMLDQYREAASAILPQVLGISENESQRMIDVSRQYISRFTDIYDQGVRAGVFRDVDSFLLNILVCNFCVLWGKSFDMRAHCADSVEKFEEFIIDVVINGIKK